MISKVYLLFFRFLALPCLVQAPRDYDRPRERLPPRRIYEVETSVLANRDMGVMRVDLDYPEEYRRELAKAHSEVFLVRDLAAPLTIIHRRPLRHYRDLVKIDKARLACGGQDPVIVHLNPLLQQLGIPLM